MDTDQLSHIVFGSALRILGTPFSVGNTHDAIKEGDFRLIDITDLANPAQIGGFPSEFVAGPVIRTASCEVLPGEGASAVLERAQRELAGT